MLKSTNNFPSTFQASSKPSSTGFPWRPRLPSISCLTCTSGLVKEHSKRCSWYLHFLWHLAPTWAPGGIHLCAMGGQTVGQATTGCLHPFSPLRLFWQGVHSTRERWARPWKVGCKTNYATSGANIATWSFWHLSVRFADRIATA